ncbi:MAG: histidine kinase [Bacteroidetes bacterium]|nr:histidine kinase [Bacteroidota bacterium]
MKSTGIQDKQRKNISVAIHVAIWLLIFTLPVLFSTDERSRTLTNYLHFAIPMLFNVLAFYLNFFLLIEAFLFRKKVLSFIIINLLLFAGIAGISYFIQEELMMPMILKTGEGMHAPPKELFWFRNAASMVLITGLSVAIRMTGQWYKAEKIRHELEKARMESELSNLKNQLSPHFFFNTLNNIYSLIAIRPDDAQKAIHQLSKLIRYVLYESDHDLVPLSSELSFTRNYIQLMSLRYPDNIRIDTKIEDAPEDIQIAPLLFISLIENAFKHGISPLNESCIRIKIQTGQQGEVECVVENSNHPKNNKDQSGSGIGLENLRKRLELIYPGKYSFNQENLGEKFVSQLIIRP